MRNSFVSPTDVLFDERRRMTERFDEINNSYDFSDFSRRGYLLPLRSPSRRAVSKINRFAYPFPHRNYSRHPSSRRASSRIIRVGFTSARPIIRSSNRPRASIGYVSIMRADEARGELFLGLDDDETRPRSCIAACLRSTGLGYLSRYFYNSGEILTSI